MEIDKDGKVQVNYAIKFESFSNAIFLQLSYLE